MSGRIKAEDIAEVRARTRIDDVIGEHVTLKSAGGGSLKGLCPFHDERTPSFHVTPSKGLYHCFGCQAGGDAIAFLMELQGLSFAEAVERLAAKAGVQLRYEEGSGPSQRVAGQRAAIIAANTAAARFFQDQFQAAAGRSAREAMESRGFDADACSAFGVGYAPGGWDGLIKHLRGKGVRPEAMLAAGLVIEGNRGAYDRFRDRIIWPIRDITGDVLGFGARRMSGDDRGPKYLNTPETLVYKKSQVLYGIDLARRSISKTQQVVVVEGYTDVMAAHLAGVENTVATCGTAFGSDHVAVLRRLLLDDPGSRGEVIFTFDSDEAGKSAALRAFQSDQQFATATFVAVEPSGLDPADLRQQQGDQAVRDLVARRLPLFEFALRSAVADVDISTAEGRMAGLRRAAPIVADIRDRALRPEYARVVAGWLGLPEATVSGAVRRAKAGAIDQDRSRPAAGPSSGLERDALRGLLHCPGLIDPWLESVEPTAFASQEYREAYEVLARTGGPIGSETDPAWLGRLLEHAGGEDQARLFRELSVEPMPLLGGPDDGGAAERYVVSLLARLLDRDAAGRMDALTARLAQPAVAGSEDARRDLQQQYRAVADFRRQLQPLITAEAQG